MSQRRRLVRLVAAESDFVFEVVTSATLVTLKTYTLLSWADVDRRRHQVVFKKFSREGKVDIQVWPSAGKGEAKVNTEINRMFDTHVFHYNIYNYNHLHVSIFDFLCRFHLLNRPPKHVASASRFDMVCLLTRLPPRDA